MKINDLTMDIEDQHIASGDMLKIIIPKISGVLYMQVNFAPPHGDQEECVYYLTNSENGEVYFDLASLTTESLLEKAYSKFGPRAIIFKMNGSFKVDELIPPVNVDIER
ncbi:hypothetical protein [Lactobacillus intestinalis]|uniref:hypothetical protein n=1 Tax=Lactobacillus intestinalis TaxID=151781 RepID=UPI00266FC13A|nr:hypothetical protein [Lactobacillus intestinalis]